MKCLTIPVIIMCLIPVCSPQPVSADQEDGSSIEIIVGGKRYPSMQGYRQEQMFEELAPKKKEEPQPSASASDDLGEMRAMFDEALRSSKQPLDLTLDPAKMKTVYVKTSSRTTASSSSSFRIPPPEDKAYRDPWAPAYTLINKVGFEDGVRRVVSEFGVTRSVSRVINAADLEHVLRDSFGDLNKPLLLISDQTSLRVMTLDPGGEGSQHRSAHDTEEP